jgi:hypothetical protein
VSRELREALAARGIDRVADVIGLGHRPPVLTVPTDADPPGDAVPEAVERRTPPVFEEDDL